MYTLVIQYVIGRKSYFYKKEEESMLEYNTIKRCGYESIYRGI